MADSSLSPKRQDITARVLAELECVALPWITTNENVPAKRPGLLLWLARGRGATPTLRTFKQALASGRKGKDGKVYFVKPADLQRFQHAVMVRARQRAKNVVLAQLRAKGLKLGQFSAKEVSERADVYFAKHMETLINEAVKDVAKWPPFARWRCANLETYEKSTAHWLASTISVQKSGAERRAKQ